MLPEIPRFFRVATTVVIVATCCNVLSMGSNHWVDATTEEGTFNEGLWALCRNERCFFHDFTYGWRYSCRVISLISCSFGILSVLVLFFNVMLEEPRYRLSAVLIVFDLLTSFGLIVVFTKNATILYDGRLAFSWSYAFKWLHILLSFISCLLIFRYLWFTSGLHFIRERPKNRICVNTPLTHTKSILVRSLTL